VRTEEVPDEREVRESKRERTDPMPMRREPLFEGCLRIEPVNAAPLARETVPGGGRSFRMVPKSQRSDWLPMVALVKEKRTETRCQHLRRSEKKIYVRIVSVLMMILVLFCPTLGLPVLMPFDELGQIGRSLGSLDESMSKQIFRCGALPIPTSGGTRTEQTRRKLPERARSTGCTWKEERTLTSFGSLCKHSETNSLNGFENWGPSVGGGFFGIRKRTCRHSIRPERERLCDQERNDDEDQEEVKTDLHRVQLGVWRFTHSHLDTSDTQAPDVGFEVIARLLDDFGRHPVRRADERILRARRRDERQ
jgi:hypothetical protein